MQEEQEYPVIDTTKFILVTKSAPLSASGCHEIVASFAHKRNAEIYASQTYGRTWRKYYEIRRSNGIR